MGKSILSAEPPWLDKGTFVRLVGDWGRGIVVNVETGHFGTLYRVRLLDLSGRELKREDLALEPTDTELEDLRDFLVVAEVLDS